MSLSIVCNDLLVRRLPPKKEEEEEEETKKKQKEEKGNGIFVPRLFDISASSRSRVIWREINDFDRNVYTKISPVHTVCLITNSPTRFQNH